MVMLLCDNYNHKLFGLIPSEEAAIFCGKTMASSSPEPKGTLTPPGSSPLGGDCAHMPHFTQSSAPPSPETPMTPDSAHMTVEGPSTNHMEVFSTEIANQEPLIGARKRKATKVHKLEPECITRTEGDSIPPPPTLTCNVCQAEMKSQHDFTRHIRTHNRIIEDDASGTKLFECGLCQKQLSSNSSLDRHMLVHSGERPFRCHICGTHFTTNGNMHRHIRGHYRNGGGGSDTGDSDGGSEGGASSPRKRRIEFEDEGPERKIGRLQNENYSADDEFSVEDLSCPVCGAEQNGVSALEVHLEKEHPERSLSLKASSSKDYADKTESSDILTTNITVIKMQEKGERVIEGLGNGIHHCPTCGLPFPSVESWLLHLRDHPTLKCNSCDISFDSISDYTTHKRRETCGFRSDGSLSLFDRHSSPPSGPIFPRNLHFPLSSQAMSLGNTDSLKKGFLSAGSPLSLTRHPSLSHHPHSPISLPNPTTSSLSHDEQFARDYKDMKLNGQYPCRLCKEVYANLRKLKSHNLVHMVAPPYQCNLCSFVSNDKNTLKEHMKNHKGDTPYECNLCSLSFTTKANCERHIKNIHGRQTRDEVKRCMTYTPQDDGPSSQEISRETICRLCKFDCKSRSVLRDHMRSSHPEGVDKPFSCKICQVSFQCSSDAYRHIIQAHQEAVSSESLETLVEQRTRREEPQDLSPVESLLTFSKLSLPISTSKPIIRPSSPISHPVVTSGSLTLHKVPAFSTTNSLVSPPLRISTYTPPAVIPEDGPLDLSMNKRKGENKGDDMNCESDDEEITIIDEEEKDEMFKNENTDNDNQDVLDLKSRSTSPHSEKPSPQSKSNFPLVYPGQLPVQFLPFQSQYPFLMNPFSALPPVANLQLFEQYKEIKRGLQLTSGGTLLSPDSSTGLLPSVCNNLLNHSSNRFLKANNSPFQLSAMSLTVPKNEQQQSEENDNSESRSQLLATDLSSTNRETEEMSHFTMRNSVLVKKPKQRRYRTERPWRCDLCDKGFTLRSNMERHMKQQHPDLWQQRLRGTPSHQRLGVSTSLSRDLFGQTSIDTSKLLLKSDTEEVTSETTDGGKEDEESELIIDDEEDEEGPENQSTDGIKREDGSADLASVQKLLSTASSQSFSFFNRDHEESDKCEDQSSPCVSPLSQDASSEEGKKSAYSSAPQKQKCPFCHRKFPWSSSLVRHIRTHTGQKPYLCPVCHFPFTTKSNCDRHLQRKHPDSPHALSGDRPYRCVKCPGAAFTSIESLRKHDMFKHEKANDTSLLIRDDLKYLGTKAFWCYLCDVRYCSSKDVLQHIAESHPESFRSLRVQDITSAPPASPPAQKVTAENMSETTSENSSSEWVICMVCYHRASCVEELKEHILSTHTQSPRKESSSYPSSPQDPNEEEEDEEEDEMDEDKEEIDEEIMDRRGEKETSEFISNMLGTKPAVIDHLISSKSTADAAKLLGVR